MTDALWVYAIGFLAQGFFSARILVQWILSERARRIVSPNAYWVCSLAGSILLFLYGWLRSDFSVMLGQLISYYIYVWNLDIKGLWQKVPRWIRIPIAVLPCVAIGCGIAGGRAFFDSLFRNSNLPLWMIVFGSAGQIVFTVRFIYQWYYSYRRHCSLLPVGFWVISLVGSGIIVSYGIMRLDPVLILGQSAGFIAYSRNILLGKRQKVDTAQRA